MQSTVQGRKILLFVAFEICRRAWGSEAVPNAIPLSRVQNKDVLRVELDIRQCEDERNNRDSWLVRGRCVSSDTALTQISFT